MATTRASAYQQYASAPSSESSSESFVCEINNALDQILASGIFNRAHRMCRLLRYLIAHSITNGGRQMSEYAIGLDVFDRNPSTYYPGEDPIVRVQMGRLRKRLISYYAILQEDPEVRVSIPLGHYEPIIERRVPQAERNIDDNPFTLSIIPLYYISDDFLGRSLTKGLNEQISQHLNLAYGSAITPFSHSNQTRNNDSATQSCYFLEGSAFIHGSSFKVTIRIVDQNTSAIMSTTQFRFPTNANLSMQVNMAREICETLKVACNMMR
jgi:TolB-like protein